MLRVPLVWLGLAPLKSEGVAGDEGRGAARINPALAVPGYARPKASEEAATRVSFRGRRRSRSERRQRARRLDSGHATAGTRVL